MRAFSTANGGVMFVPDEIERLEKKTAPISYNELVQGESQPEKRSFISRLLGKSKKSSQKQEDKDLIAA